MDRAKIREPAMRHRLSLGVERWTQNTRQLPPLSVGQKVFIQNQRGARKLAKRWDRTGTVVEDKNHDKYSVEVDGSGRLADGNRRYLRAFKPDTQTSLPAPRTLSPPPITPHVHGQEDDVARQPAVQHDGEGYTVPHTTPDRTMQGLSAPQQEEPGAVRRSGCVRQPNVKYPTAVFDMSSVTKNVFQPVDVSKC